MTSQLHSRIALRGQAGDFHVHLTVHNASQLEHATHVVEANYRSVCGRWRPAAARAHRLYLRLLLAKRTRKFSLVRCSPGGEIAVRCTFHVEYADYEPDLSAAGDECLKHQGAAPHPMIFIVAHVPESRTAAGSRPTEHHERQLLPALRRGPSVFVFDPNHVHAQVLLRSASLQQLLLGLRSVAQALAGGVLQLPGLRSCHPHLRSQVPLHLGVPHV